MLRNSPSLEALDNILHDPQSTHRAVEIVGRGIAASARSTRFVLTDKAIPNAKPLGIALRDASEFADRLMDLGRLEDALVEVWQRRSEGDLGDAPFEEELERVVAGLEAWP